MKIGVISPQKGWGTNQLLISAKKLIEADYIPFDKLSYNKKTCEYLESFDAIILKGISQTIDYQFRLELLDILGDKKIKFFRNKRVI